MIQTNLTTFDTCIIVSVQRVSRNCDGDADDQVIYAEEVGGPGAGQFLCSDN